MDPPGLLSLVQIGQGRCRKIKVASVQAQVRVGPCHGLRKHLEHQETLGTPWSWAAGLPLDGSSTVAGCVLVSRAIVRDEAAEPASSQGLGLRGSRDAVGSPWVAVMWRFSRPGSSWPFWTRCRSSPRVTEAGAGSADASAPLGLETPPRWSMSHHQLTHRIRTQALPGGVGVTTFVESRGEAKHRIKELHPA